MEITDTELVIGVIITFVGGIVAFYLVNRLSPYLKSKVNDLDPSQLERLEYYERQLIDMKIRLDALEMSEQEGYKSPEVKEELNNILEKISQNKEISSQKYDERKKSSTSNQELEITENESSNITEHALRLITQKPMTSRDIQTTLKRSREHTSRLLKKLYDEGLVDRNTESKPYTYSISKKGKEKLGILNSVA